MKPIFFTIDKSLPLKIIPDTQAHLDGHPILTYNYNIYFDSSKNDPETAFKSDESSDNMTNPDYYGYISIEKPGQIFSYTPGDYKELTRDEIEEVIEQLNHYRNNPAMWDTNEN